MRGGIALAGLALVFALALAALAAPALPLGSPTAIAKDHALHGPTVGEPFGMDDLGRSVLSRVVHAYRISLGVAICSVLLALAIGGPLGLVAGYAEGWPDQLIMRPLDVLMAFPAILLAIALMSVFGTGAVLLSVALAIVYTPVMARVARAAVLFQGSDVGLSSSGEAIDALGMLPGVNTAPVAAPDSYTTPDRPIPSTSPGDPR